MPRILTAMAMGNVGKMAAVAKAIGMAAVANSLDIGEITMPGMMALPKTGMSPLGTRTIGRRAMARVGAKVGVRVGGRAVGRVMPLPRTPSPKILPGGIDGAMAPLGGGAGPQQPPHPLPALQAPQPGPSLQHKPEPRTIHQVSPWGPDRTLQL